MCITFTVQTGHTLDEYESKYGEQYANGDLWDYPYGELFDGTTEPQEGMTYWLIGDRLYETEE